MDVFVVVVVVMVVVLLLLLFFPFSGEDVHGNSAMRIIVPNGTSAILMRISVGPKDDRKKDRQDRSVEGREKREKSWFAVGGLFGGGAAWDAFTRHACTGVGCLQSAA